MTRTERGWTHLLFAAVLTLAACQKEAEKEADVADRGQPDVATDTAESSSDVPPAGTPEVDRQVLVTIDDLPIAMRSQYRSDAERRETIDRLVAIFRDREIPVVGFFNMKHHAADPTLTEKWVGLNDFTAGNHTWSHPNARRTKLKAFLREVERGHKAVSKIAPEQRSVPFRFPYLNQGSSREKRNAIFARLDELNSPHVPITIHTQDWLHARTYLDALHEGDEDRAERARNEWFTDIRESTAEAEFWARKVTGREPPQILLLHANRLNADHLDEALDWYERRGYRFVDLEEATGDPAYAEPDRSVSRLGASFWIRLHRSRRLKSEDAAP